MLLDSKWHSLSSDIIQDELKTDFEAGLNRTEVDKRLLEYGKNEISVGKSKPAIFTFLSQFNDPLVYILIVSALICILFCLFEVLNRNLFGSLRLALLSQFL